MSDTVVCFDLDDTLYKEIDFLRSAYKEVASVAGHPEAYPQMVEWYHAGENVFVKLIDTYGLSMSVSDCLEVYRNHFPCISLDEGVMDSLDRLKEYGAKLGLISDGRSITQRNKMKALGLEGMFDIEIISEEFGSEKMNLKNFQAVMERFPERKHFIYVGDNPAKDFWAANQLGWKTVCLKNDGRNIHEQKMSVRKDYMPRHVVGSIDSFVGTICGLK